MEEENQMHVREATSADTDLVLGWMNNKAIHWLFKAAVCTMICIGSNGKQKRV
jgi:hypothetical protein